MTVRNALPSTRACLFAVVVGTSWASTALAQQEEEAAPKAESPEEAEGRTTKHETESKDSDASKDEAETETETETETDVEEGVALKESESPEAGKGLVDAKEGHPKSPATKIPEPVTQPKPAERPRPKVNYSKLPWTYHQKRIDLGAGLLIGFVRDPAFDLFQSKDGYTAFEARGAIGLWASGSLSVAVTANYNFASAEGEARTLPSFLGVRRAHVGGEVRYHFLPRLHAYGRVDAGAFFAQSRLGEAGAPTRMELSEWGFSAGAHAGGAVRVAGSADGRKRAPRLHLFLEGGLEYDSPLKLTYEMGSAGALRPAPVELGSLSLGGPIMVLGALVSY